MKKLQSHKKKNLRYPALVAGLIGSLALSSCKDDTPRLTGSIEVKPNPEQHDQRLDGDIRMPIKTEKDQLKQPEKITQPRVKEKIKVESKPQRLMGEMPPPDKERPRLLGKIKILPNIYEVMLIKKSK